jgi:hypothetical protein
MMLRECDRKQKFVLKTILDFLNGFCIHSGRGPDNELLRPQKYIFLRGLCFPHLERAEHNLMQYRRYVPSRDSFKASAVLRW